MSRADAELPADYVRFAAGDGVAVARRGDADAVRAALAAGTLERYAAQHPARRELHGRGAVYAVPLPGGTRVVVRHARHGGVLAPITGDRFLAPTRAPHELHTALRLAAAGVPTPPVVAYVLYGAGPLLRRSDMATAEIAGGLDLPAALVRWPESRAALFRATARLLAQLARAGARHPDMNVKNVLLTTYPHDVAPPRAYVLDVDRVVIGRAGDPRIAEANLRRFVRSARKLRKRRDLDVSDAELQHLADAARAVAS